MALVKGKSHVRSARSSDVLKEALKEAGVPVRNQQKSQRRGAWCCFYSPPRLAPLLPRCPVRFGRRPFRRGCSTPRRTVTRTGAVWHVGLRRIQEKLRSKKRAGRGGSRQGDRWQWQQKQQQQRQRQRRQQQKHRRVSGRQMVSNGASVLPPPFGLQASDGAWIRKVFHGNQGGKVAKSN